MVLAGHVPLAPDAPARRVLSVGSYGVDLFFVLSGYLISSLLLAELEKRGRIDLGRFWLRRGLKIWPSYFVAYGVMVALQSWFDLRYGSWQPPGTRLDQAVPNLFFVQNYVRLETRWFASWSLAIEEHFYLLLPLLIVGLAAAGRRTAIVHAGVGVALLVLACRCLARPEAREVLVYIQTHYRADGLCLGVLLGYLDTYHRERFMALARRHWLPVILVPAAFALPFYFPWGAGVVETWGLTVMSLCFAATVAAAVARDRSGRKVHPVLRPAWLGLAWVGTYSYTIYLAQAASIVIAHSGVLRELSGEGFVAGSLIGGLVLSHVIERPFLRFREQWIPRAASAAPPAAAGPAPAHSPA